MGLVVHSLELLSPQANRDYYVYILDYGWDEPFANILRQNFYKISNLACQTESAVIIGSADNMGHFDNQVLSWHHVNGEDAEDLLPAILITRVNPHAFKNSSDRLSNIENFKIILIPLRNVCKNPTDLMPLITSIFKDIQNKKDLSQFKIAKELKRGINKAIIDSIILEPNFYGIGFSFKKFKEFLG